MAAAAPSPASSFAVRGSNGLWVCSLPDGARHGGISDDSRDCKSMTYSHDGSRFAWVNATSVQVARTSDGHVLQSYPFPRTCSLRFSPKGSFLAAWEPYAVRKGQSPGEPNLHVWNVSTGDCVTSYVQKKSEGWHPMWSADEELCARVVTGEVHFFNGGVPDGAPVQKLRLENIKHCAISPSTVPYYIASYQPGSKGGPAFIRLYRYPGFENVLASRSIFKCDNVKISWNVQGTAFLGVTSVEVDSSGASYYGEQGLQYLDTTGAGTMVTLSKKGPIYSSDWHPNGREFCVVYGFMPAKATLFNQKCEPVFDFGTGPRNAVNYNSHGTVMCLSGFGNLPGHLEFWSREKLQLVSKCQASDTTSFQWCPDGEHFLTATTAPRLRQDNGYRIWHYSGRDVGRWSVPGAKDELWQVCCQPVPYGTFRAKAVIGVQASITQESKSKPAAYRPPGARGTTSSLKLHENERPQVVGAAAAMKAEEPAKPLSKSAQKNKKRRGGKKEDASDTSTAPGSAVTQAQRDAVAMATCLVAPAPAASAAAVSTTPVENEKKIRALRKKLQQIEKLKAQQAEGKTLEGNQLEKLKGEDELLRQIKELSVGS
ncbi:eukaryotic translation initiation factor 2A-like [Sycon ciliatum]|uniref:eukaryotic translation initiation factor 2A-like n=1 Tax=Sycon ciliatum TaxID=27933 RepID=UPI0020AB60C6|eukprot:scpid67032/ scgid23437/ Eukaryotic translation initiation factor 2A